MEFFRWKESEYLSFIPDVEEMPAKEFNVVFRFLRTQKRLEELEDSMGRIESALKKLTVEWDETYEKFRHLHFRVSKRVKALEQVEVPEIDQDVPVESGPAAPQLTPRQIEANARILARRSKMTQ